MGFTLRHWVIFIALSFVTLHAQRVQAGDDNFLFARIGVAKAVSSPVKQANNTYNLTYTITLKNYGDETITSVNVEHILATEFPGATTTLVGNVVATGSLLADNNFNSTALNVTLLKAGSKLYPGEKQTIVYTVNINLNSAGFGPFLGIVTATGFGNLAIPVLDISVPGLDPDPNGDGSPLESGNTSILFSAAPVIGVAKSAGAPVHQADGTENVTYTVTVKNLGNEKLTNVQVKDVLTNTFINPATFTVVSAPISNGTLSGNAAFNGSSNTNLLASGGTLAVGAQQTITFTVNINPHGLFGPFSNSVTATADGSAAPTIDISVNGNNPDPNGDGLPLEFSPTLVSLIPVPIIGIAKKASAPALQGDNSYNITYTITLKNYGNINLTNVQVTDVLTSAFSNYVVVGAVVTSGSLIAKVGYDGNAVNNLLATGSTLNVGATQTITFTVNVKPNGILGPYINTALASALGGIVPVSDASVDGNDPDPNGDGLPLELSPTLSLLIPIPVIGVSKSASAPVAQPNGTYNVTFKITVENLGNENLENVQVTDALASVFIAPSVYNVVGNVVTSGTLAAKVGFNGGLVTELLGPGSKLGVGQKQTISFTINVDPKGNFIPYLNTAVATASGATSNLPTTDISVDGDDPDPNGDGLPLETLPTTTLFEGIPLIGLSKAASAPVVQADGSYNVTFTLKVENLGNEKLFDVQVTDALASVFIAPSVYNIVGNVVTSGTLAANAGFNGNLVKNLLANGSTLNVGETQTITFTVNVKPNALFGPFLNTAIATAHGALLPTTDISVDGNDPDPNGDGLPLEFSPTIVSLIPVPLIGVSKSASSPVQQPDQSYLVTFTITLKNMGNETLQNVQVTDALVSIFGPDIYSMVGNVVANGTLIANAGFNGNLVTNLLAPGSTLAVGATQTINFTVKLKPNLLFGPFLNQVIATATGSLLPTTDISVDGNNPDPNGDGLPLEFSPTTVLLIPVPVIGLAKSASAPLLQPDGSYLITYTFTVKNMGNVKLDNVQITDVMASIFTSQNSTFAILGPAVASGTLIANPTFDGDLSTNLLNSGSTLNVGETQTTQVTIRAKPALGFLGPFINTAVATATGLLLPTADLSMDGTNPDPNGDGLPLETLPTIVGLTPNPVIGIAKDITSTVLQADGSYNVTYDIRLKNYGNVDLEDVFVTDNLSSIFNLAAGVSLTANVNVSNGLAANVGFNGFLDINLLDGAQSKLPVGGSATITYTVNVKPGGIFGPYCNTAIATARAAGGLALTLDISHRGTNPDPNGNGKPNELDENECTPISLTPNPVIGLAKSASSPVLQPNNSYNVTYTILVKNMGNSALTNVSVIDDFALAFPLSDVATNLVGTVSTTGTLLPNISFDGFGVKELLNPTSTLAIGATGTIVFTLNMTPGANFGPYYNSAEGSGQSGARRASDYSTNGTDPDPNHNGNPGDPGESAATPVSFEPNPIIGIAKAASSAILQPDNVTYNVTLTFTVTNYGNVDLENVQLTDDLAAAFPSPTTYSIIGSISSPGTLIPNSAYNGSTDKNLLAAGSTLARGATERVTVNIAIKPNGGTFNFVNTSSGSAKAVGSTKTASDVSTNGNNPDPNNNGNPSDSGENTTTAITLTPNPVIGIAKSTGNATLLPNGSYNIPFTITVANLGNVGLKDVQVTDNLASVISAPATYSVVGAISVTGSLVANGSFNGNSDTNLLAPGSLVAVGTTSTISFTINIAPNNFFGPFANSASGTGTSLAGGLTTTDISTNGNNPDPNGNGNPGDPGENTATSFSLTPNAAFGVSLNASVPQLQGDGSYRVVFTVLVKNLGNVAFTEMSVNQSLNAAITAPATYTLISPPTSSGSFAVNTSYDGNSNTQLIAPNQKLAVGASETITITAAIRPQNNTFGPFFVSASATGKTASGSYSDLSAPGTNPDPNNNGNPADPGENDPTPVTLQPYPVLGVAQSATSTLQPDGKYKVNFLVTVRNMGNADITNLQVTNNLTNTFNSPLLFAMSGGVTATGSLIANTNYNGSTNINLLNGGTLPIGSVQLITFSVIVDQNGSGNLGPFFSNAYGSGTAGAITYNDISTAGTNPDPNTNGSPSDPGEDLPTIINLTPSIVAGIAKAVSFVQIQPDGAFRVTYTLTVQNLGNTPINNIKVTDHLAAAFPSPATFSVVPGSPFTTGQLVANTSYNGTTNVDLLAAGSKLPVGADNTITLAVDVKLNGGGGLFFNSATLTALSDDSSLSFADISAPGNDPDPNHNGNPGDPGENSPTSVTLTPKATVGLAKALGTPRRQGDGSYNVPYRLTIKNMGNVALNDLKIEDDLSATFPSPAAFTVTSVTSETGLKVNTAFGAGDKNLLLSGNNLQIGQTATVDFVVKLAQGSGGGPFYNTAKATASGAGGTGFTTDVSTTGNNPDPNGNGNPGDPGEDEATSLQIVITPVVGVAKAVAPPKLVVSDNSYDVTYTLTVKNLGDIPLYNVGLYDNIAFAFPSPATFTIKGSPQATGSLVINNTYDGDIQFNLLDQNSTLDIGQTETVTFTVNVLAPPSDQVYYNSAIAAATNEDNTMTYTDISTTGLDPDPNGNGNPNDVNENIPTSVQLKLIPVIGLANDATNGILQPDGTYNVEITITIDNLGNDELENIQINNSLKNTFPDPMVFRIVTAPVATGNLVVNPGYNGTTDTRLIESGTLDYGDSRTVKFTINITPNDNFGVFWNSALGTGIGVRTDNSTSDTSNRGLRTDPTRTGKPDQFALNAATPIELKPKEVLGVATFVTSVVPASSCNYLVTMNVALENYGNATLHDIAVVDNLVGISFTGATYTVQSINATNGLVVNNNFNGNTDKNLLGPGNNLSPGGTSNVTLLIEVAPNQHYGPYQNVVTAAATGPQNPVFDESVNAITPDPDGNRIPDESSVTAIDIVPVDLFIPEGFSPNGDGANDNFIIVLECGMSADLTIYNRWGDKVFFKKNYVNEFDGTSNEGSFMGKPLPEGTYFYKIELSSGDKMASFITLKR